MDEYASALDRLAAEGLTYRCFCTRAEIAEEARRSQEAPHGPDGPVYPGTCRSLSPAQAEDLAASGKSFAIRLDIAKAVRKAARLEWHDRRLGDRLGRPERFGDVVLARKETPASYHLCVVVDDAAQGIDLVTRGRDLVDATDVHVLLQSLLGLPTPDYEHHGLVLDDAGQRMAKRAASTTVRSLREQGWSPPDVLAEAARRLESGDGL